LTEKSSLFNEFVEWGLREEVLDEEYFKQLLRRPRSSDDFLLYHMAEFALEKVFGKPYGKSTLDIGIVIKYDEYDGASYVFIFERKTRSFLAESSIKAWHKPSDIERELRSLICQLKDSESLLAIRMVYST